MKNRSDKSACAYIFLELPSINYFRHCYDQYYDECNIIVLIIHWLLYIDYFKYVRELNILDDSYILYYLHLQLWNSHRSRIQKQPPEMFLKFSQISHENTCVGAFFFYKVASLQTYYVIKKRLLHSCFTERFEKFFRAPFLKNIYERLLQSKDYSIAICGC